MRSASAPMTHGPNDSPTSAFRSTRAIRSLERSTRRSYPRLRPGATPSAGARRYGIVLGPPALEPSGVGVGVGSGVGFDIGVGVTSGVGGGVTSAERATLGDALGVGRSVGQGSKIRFADGSADGTVNDGTTPVDGSGVGTGKQVTDGLGAAHPWPSTRAPHDGPNGCNPGW